MRGNDLPWFYVPTLPAAPSSVVLEGEEWHHALHVLRLRTGEHITVFDGQGALYEGKIISSGRSSGEIEIIQPLEQTPDSTRSYKVIVAMAPVKNPDRTTFAIEKLTESGIDEIHFLDCDHNERIRVPMERWHKVLVGAAKQSRKKVLPLMRDLTSPDDLLLRMKSEYPLAQYICCHPGHDNESIAENYTAGRDVILMIGPEGGFSEKEILKLKTQDVLLTTISPFRLRTETAAITACIQIHLLNDPSLHP